MVRRDQSPDLSGQSRFPFKIPEKVEKATMPGSAFSIYLRMTSSEAKFSQDEGQAFRGAGNIPLSSQIG
jgi:hypothetical protein